MAVEPDVRQPRAGPGARMVFAKVRLGTARLVADHRRAGVAVAELGADHLVALALLDFGDFDELGQVLPQRAPLAPAERGVARRGDVALADLAPLGLVGGEQPRPAPAAQRAGELP